MAEKLFDWDRHIWDVPDGLIVGGLKIALTTQILFGVSVVLTKLSMLTLTYRVVAQGSGNYSRWIIAAMVLVAAQGITFAIEVLFQCGYVRPSFLSQRGQQESIYTSVGDDTIPNYGGLYPIRRKIGVPRSCSCVAAAAPIA